MDLQGKLIAIEGIDGVGKATLVKNLRTLFIGEDYTGDAPALLGSPTYFDPVGELVGDFLNGRLGPPIEIDARAAALLYAVNRRERYHHLRTALHDGPVLYDRYTPSNLAFQCAKVDDEAKRRELLKWIEYVEYDVLDLPAPDLVLHLDLASQQAAKLVAKKKPREYTAEADHHERSLAYQERVRACYFWVAPWARCGDWVTLPLASEDGELQPPEVIAQAAMEAIRVHFQAGESVVRMRHL